MSIDDNLKFLLAHCKCEVSIAINSHRSCYESIADHLDFRSATEEDYGSEEIRSEMIARDTLVEVQFYPRTPIGFHLVMHYDLASALDRAVECLKLATPEPPQSAEQSASPDRPAR